MSCPASPIRAATWRSNLELAKQRAKTVREALVAAGVPAERIALVKPTDVIVGQGSDADARRVDIILR